MHQFRISETGFKKFRKKWLTTIIPLATIIVAIVIITNVVQSNTADDVNTLPFVLPFILALLCFSFYRSLRKQKKLLLSYCVTISGEGITREQMNTPPLSISFMEIKEIIKTEKGAFMIKGTGRADVILIPHWIDDPALLEERLKTLAPITVNIKDPFYRKYGGLLFIPAIGMMVCLYTVTNKIIVGICGTLLTAILIWAFYEVRTSKNIPTNTKRSSWVFLIVLVSIIYVTWLKLTGTPAQH
jgi:hypothetical protein